MSNFITDEEINKEKKIDRVILAKLMIDSGLRKKFTLNDIDLDKIILDKFGKEHLEALQKTERKIKQIINGIDPRVIAEMAKKEIQEMREGNYQRSGMSRAYQDLK